MGRSIICLLPNEIIDIYESTNDIEDVFRLYGRSNPKKKRQYRTLQINHPEHGWIAVYIHVFNLQTRGNSMENQQTRRDKQASPSVSFTSESSFTFKGKEEFFGRSVEILSEVEKHLIALEVEKDPHILDVRDDKKFYSSFFDPKSETTWINVKIRENPIGSKKKGYMGSSNISTILYDGLKRTGGSDPWELYTIDGNPVDSENIHIWSEMNMIILFGQINFNVIYLGDTSFSCRGKFDTCVKLPPIPKVATISNCNPDIIHCITNEDISVYKQEETIENTESENVIIVNESKSDEETFESVFDN